MNPTGVNLTTLFFNTITHPKQQLKVENLPTAEIFFDYHFFILLTGILAFVLITVTIIIGFTKWKFKYHKPAATVSYLIIIIHLILNIVNRFTM